MAEHRGERMTLSALLVAAIQCGQEQEYHKPARFGLITTAKVYFRDIRELQGRPLGCFCSLNEPCHVDVLRVMANRHLLTTRETSELLGMLAPWSRSPQLRVRTFPAAAPPS